METMLSPSRLRVCGGVITEALQDSREMPEKQPQIGVEGGDGGRNENECLLCEYQ